jgi:flagellar biosynthesis protein FlhB
MLKAAARQERRLCRLKDLNAISNQTKLFSVKGFAETGKAVVRKGPSLP